MMNNKTELLIATKNIGKAKEIRNLLADSPLDVCDLNKFPIMSEPEETGATFLENANLKANYYALQTGCWSLADDSGLEVEALNGAPGVFSARYAGINASDSERIEKLLGELGNNENRRARFVCAMAVADANGDIKFNAEGICDGKIALKASGTNGFGYDPLFIPANYLMTFGELSNDIKQQISHRKQALSKIIQQIRRFYSVLT